MKAFEVFVNGEKICVAGVADGAIINAIVSWVGKHEPGLHVGGLENDVHLRWLKSSTSPLKVGDEVVIRLVDVDAVDEPVERFERLRQKTRAEVESEVRGHLQAAYDLLPPSASQGERLARYETHLEEGHLIGATDVLGALSDSNTVPAKFWDCLSDACHSLTQYEDHNRYRDKFKSAKKLADEEK